MQNQMHDIINPKYLKKKRKKNLKYPQGWNKDESIDTLSPAIYLEGWARHFEHEYIIKLSKKRYSDPYQLNLMVNSGQVLALFRQTQTLRTDGHGSQQDSIHHVSFFNPDRNYFHIM